MLVAIKTPDRLIADIDSTIRRATRHTQILYVARRTA
jgi:hypothetical protein